MQRKIIIGVGIVVVALVATFVVLVGKGLFDLFFS